MTVVFFRLERYNQLSVIGCPLWLELSNQFIVQKNRSHSKLDLESPFCYKTFPICWGYRIRCGMTIL